MLRFTYAFAYNLIDQHTLKIRIFVYLQKHVGWKFESPTESEASIQIMLKAP